MQKVVIIPLNLSTQPNKHSLSLNKSEDYVLQSLLTMGLVLLIVGIDWLACVLLCFYLIDSKKILQLISALFRIVATKYKDKVEKLA